MAATSGEPDPVPLAGEHVHPADDPTDTEVSEEPSEQSLLEDLARSNATLIRANESVVRATEAAERARRRVQRAQRALDHRRDRHLPEPTAEAAPSDTTPT